MDKFNGKITVLYIPIGSILCWNLYNNILIHYSIICTSGGPTACMHAQLQAKHIPIGDTVSMPVERPLSTTWINAMEKLHTKWGHVILEPNNSILSSVPGDWELIYEGTFMILNNMNHIISNNYVWHVMSYVDANLTYFETKLLQWKCTKCGHSMVDPRKHIVNLLYSWTTDKWRNKCMQWWNHERMEAMYQALTH